MAGLRPPQLAALAANSFRASFLLDEAAQARHCADVAAALREWATAAAGSGGEDGGAAGGAAATEAATAS